MEVTGPAAVGPGSGRWCRRAFPHFIAAPADADDVRGRVRAQSSRFAVPRDVVFLAELPRNATEKVVHRELGTPSS